MDFEKRLEEAISRGQRRQATHAREQADQAVSEEELRRLHSQYRLDLSDHIEQALRRLPDHFPGFRYETLSGDRGWGASVKRDDVRRGGNSFSRLEMAVRPFSSSQVLELTAKGTIANKEIFNRTHFQRVGEVDFESFRQMIDLWIIEYAERFAAQG
ncbi:MAG: hypothetical protein HYX69_17230 [Planctomycetia bacterium]|nr:hypothetical protein [Planctomycetia bacterium]